MKTLFFAALLALATGCGFRTSMTTMRDGVPISQTDIGAGFNTSASRDNALGRYETCLADVGGLPDREAFCAEQVANELRLEQRYLECAAGTCYDPNGYRQYVLQPR